MLNRINDEQRNEVISERGKHVGKRYGRTRDVLRLLARVSSSGDPSLGNSLDQRQRRGRQGGDQRQDKSRPQISVDLAPSDRRDGRKGEWQQHERKQKRTEQKQAKINGE